MNETIDEIDRMLAALTAARESVCRCEGHPVSRRLGDVLARALPRVLEETAAINQHLRSPEPPAIVPWNDALSLEEKLAHATAQLDAVWPLFEEFPTTHADVVRYWLSAIAKLMQTLGVAGTREYNKRFARYIALAGS